MSLPVDLCGHATLATAHALRSDCGTFGTIRFSSRSGILIAHDDGTITLDFPAVHASEVAVPDGLAEALTGLQASARTGLVRTIVHGDRVYLTGRAVTVLDGTLQYTASDAFNQTPWFTMPKRNPKTIIHTRPHL